MRGKAWLLCGVMSVILAADWSPNQHRQYQEMIRQFHCSVCYQESLVDSRSPFAEGLRQQIYRLVDAGTTNSDIIDYVTSRYGHSVNYEPEWVGAGVLLWIGPPILWLLIIRRLSSFIKRPR